MFEFIVGPAPRSWEFPGRALTGWFSRESKPIVMMMI
jgi:hypothetical protein